jgi:hypothetical protein
MEKMEKQSTRHIALIVCCALGCAADERSPTQVTAASGTPRGEDVVERFELILGDDPDPSVLADAETLIAAWTLPEGFGEDDDAERVVIEYMGVGVLAPMPEQIEQPGPESPLSDEELDALPAEDPNFSSFVGINPATRNQFRVTMPRQVIEALEPNVEAPKPAVDAGPGDGNPGDGDPGESDPGAAHPGDNDAPSPLESHGPRLAGEPTLDGSAAEPNLVAEADPLHGWSANIDNRQRIYGLNAGVAGVQRWQGAWIAT